jgi:sulfide:quinone oxidoreductase
MNAKSGQTRLLIAGGGVAALEAVIALRELAEERVSVELLAPNAEFAYKPLAVAEAFGSDPDMRYDLLSIADDLGASFRLGTLHEVDEPNRVVRTTRGEDLSWDLLFVAVGARMSVGIEGAVTVKGPGYTGRFRTVLHDLENRRLRRVTFAVPPGASWSLPLYELALMTAGVVQERGLRKVELRFVTPEAEPLELFGAEASQAVRGLLDERGIELYTSRYPAAAEEDGLALVPRAEGPVPADRVVSLPRLRGPEISGLPADSEGFIPVDLHGRVRDLETVFAAGDATDFSIKQGGIATQQADAAAEAIAAAAGAPVDPEPFRPILRGLLLTGEAPRFMRAEVSGGRGEDWEVSESALWWPPSKVAGRYLSPYMGVRHGELARPSGGVPVEVALDPHAPPGPRRRTVIAPARDGNGHAEAFDLGK